jgi:hypothetical protein
MLSSIAFFVANSNANSNANSIASKGKLMAFLKPTVQALPMTETRFTNSQDTVVNASVPEAGLLQFQEMEDQLLVIDQVSWENGGLSAAHISALEAGKVLYFPRLAFNLNSAETRLLTPLVRDPKARNISLTSERFLRGAVGDMSTLTDLESMLARFSHQAQQLVERLLPEYGSTLRKAPTSYRPSKVETRTQSWRADDRRLHVDAFASRPNYGERILRVFSNINPEGTARVWRIGEPFDVVARHFLPDGKAYLAWWAKCLHMLGVTKTLRSEYDHLMLQLHDCMKSDLDYQQDAHQVTVAFPAGTSWMCFSDQTSHAVMSGQYMLEQTFHLPVNAQYDYRASPLSILSQMTGRTLI